MPTRTQRCKAARQRRVPQVLAETSNSALHHHAAIEGGHPSAKARVAAAGGLQLPQVDSTIGGEAVDVIIGIKYLKYFPVLVFSLPSGLAIYRARFNSYSGTVKSYLILIQEVKMDGLLPQQSDQNQYILKLFMILFIYLVVL